MRTFNKTIMMAVLLIGLAGCSGNGPKIIKTEEYQDNWDKELRIRATYTDSTVVVFALRNDKPQEAILYSIEKLNSKGVAIIPEKITSNNVTYTVTCIDEEAFSGSDVTDVTTLLSTKKSISFFEIVVKSVNSRDFKVKRI